MTSQPPQDEVEEVARAICREDGRATCAFDDERAEIARCTISDCSMMAAARAAIATIDRLRSAAPAAGKTVHPQIVCCECGRFPIVGFNPPLCISCYGETRK